MPHRRDGRGVTIVELLIVVAMLAIMAAVAIPVWNAAMAQRRLIGAATRVANDLQYAKSRAVTQGLLQRVHFGTDGSYTLEQSTDGGTNWTTVRPPYALSSDYSGVSITSVLDKINASKTEVRFDSQGAAANPAPVSYPITITITAPSGTKLVQVVGIGSVRIP